MSSETAKNTTAAKKATRIGSAAAITMVGGTIFVDGQPVAAASFEVTTLNAVGAGSLFEAVQDANATPAADTITFAAGLTGEINIGATTLNVKEDLTITGPGSDVITITNTGAGTNNIVYLYNEASLTISSVTLDDAAEDAIATSNTVLVAPAVHAGDITLTDVVIDNAFDDGLDVRHTGTVTLNNTVITNSGGSGAQTRLTSDVTVVGSTFSDNGDYGAQFREVTGSVSVSGSAFDDNADGGLDTDTVSGNVTVTGTNTFHHNYAEGLYIEDVDGDVTVTDASLIGNSDDSLYIDTVGGNVVVERVSIADSNAYAAHIDNVTGDVTVRDLTITTAYSDGLYVQRVTGAVLIERVDVTDVGDNGVRVDTIGSTVTLRDISVEGARDEQAVEIDDATGDVLVERVTMINNDGGLYINDSLADVTVRTVVVDRTVEDEGVRVRDTTGDVLIDDADISQTYGYAVKVSESDADVTIKNVTVDTSFNYGIDVSSTIGSVLVEDVDIDTTLEGDGIEIDSDGLVTLRRVSVANAYTNGVEVRSAEDGVVIEDLTVERSKEDGLRMAAIDGPLSIDNVSIDRSYDDGFDLSSNSGSVVAGASSISNVTITNSGSEGLRLASVGAPVPLTVTDVVVDQAEDEGIEITNAASVTLDRVTVAGADSGGIRASSAADLTITTSTISGNRDSDESGAGGIELSNNTVATISHSTISDNDGDPDIDDDGNPDPGGTIDPAGAVRHESSSTVTIDHSIVAGNNSSFSFSDDATGSRTVTNSLVDAESGLGGAGGNIATADPLLGALQNNGGASPTMKPQAGSPAIDAGDPGIAGEPATDQRGFARKNGTIDIGAVEVDSGGTLALSAAAVTVAESAGSVDLTVTRTGGQDGEATVTLATADGTAESGSDFTGGAQTITLADNEMSKTVSIPIIDDGDDEPDETFTATLSAVSGATLGAPASATVTITDDDDEVVVVDEAVTVTPPQRFADTRPSGETIDDIAEKTGKLSPGDEITVQIAGRGGVPADAVGVVMNVTAIAAEGNGFVTAHACVSPRPLASSLNYTAGVNLGNEVIAGLSASGEVCLFSSNGAHLTVDVVGYISASSPLKTVTPGRVLDTRANGETVDGLSEGDGQAAADSETTLKVAGRAGVPADAAAVIVNVTAIGAAGTGFVTVHPCVSPRPLASSLNYVAGVNRGNELVASLNSDGELCLYTSAATDLAVDVVGYLPAGSNLNSVTPARLLDSRPGEPTVDGQSAGDGKLDADDEVTLQVGGRAGVPVGAKAAVINVTAIAAESNGFVTVHPCVTPRPLASSLNYVPGVNGGNEIIAALNSNGEICLYTSSKAHLAVDIVAYLD